MPLSYFMSSARQMPSVPPPTPTRAHSGHTLTHLPDNPTDLAPAAYSIKCTYLFAICLCYRAYLPIACPVIHSNFEFGPSKVYLSLQ